MHKLAIKTLAAGFAATMVLSGKAASFPTTDISPARLTSQLEVSRPAASYNKNSESVSSYDSSIDRWLEKLIILESNGKENIKILDNNGKNSFGCLQFQKQTFKEFGLKYGLVSSADEINDLIYDCELQKELAKRMLEENYDNWRHWYTSVKVKNLGLPPAVSKVELPKLKKENITKIKTFIDNPGEISVYGESRRTIGSPNSTQLAAANAPQITEKLATR